ncbi:MAG: AAA domain-containing protein [Myxococcales bacterium]|nr:AAA domain-containing protein [Myxococcales bacterium]
MSERKSRKSKKDGAERANGTPQVDWDFVERCLGARGIRTVYFHGPPGLGKTYAAYNKGNLTSAPYAVTLTEETPSAELRGFWAPRGGELVWQDGPVVRALREGARLVINELACASPDVLAFLYPILESRETARLTLPTGETVEPAPGFAVICTSNEPPEALPEALRDRFDCTILIDAPHPEALRRLSPELRQAALQTFDLDPDRALSLRAWIKVEELREELGLRDACIAVFGAERGRHVHEALTMKQLELHAEAS